MEKDINDYLFGLSDEELADAVLPILDRELRGHSAGALLHTVVSNIGCAVYRQYFLNEHKAGLADQLRTTYAEYAKVMADPQVRGARSGREVWDELSEQYIARHPHVEAKSGYVEWPLSIIKRVGVRLVDLVVSVASVSHLDAASNTNTSTNTNTNTATLFDGMEPFGQRITAADEDAEALYHTYDFVGAKKVSLVRCHPRLDKRLRRAGGSDGDEVANTKVIAATSLPMLSLPKPWTGLRSSPYLIMPQALVRCGQDAFQHLSFLSREEQGMSEVYDALNQLSSTPWQINDRVLNVMTPLFVDGGAWNYLDIPAQDLEVPPPIPRDADITPEERRALRDERALAMKLRNENAGLRAEFTTRIAIAERFQGKTFYLPHNLDFRGRAYVMPPHLSHLGSDGTRALLKFSDKKPLGERGLFWLKVHVANLYGVDKVRCAFSTEIYPRGCHWFPRLLRLKRWCV
jgi:DNA-directed RNA polymerase